MSEGERVTICIRDENYSPVEKVEYTGKTALYCAIRHVMKKHFSIREVLKLLSEI